MTFFEILVTFFELAAVVLLIVGFINEKKVVAFEVKLARAIRIHLRNRRLLCLIRQRDRVETIGNEYPYRIGICLKRRNCSDFFGKVDFFRGYVFAEL